jgi:hypothetical protein
MQLEQTLMNWPHGRVGKHRPVRWPQFRILHIIKYRAYDKPFIELHLVSREEILEQLLQLCSTSVITHLAAIDTSTRKITEKITRLAVVETIPGPEPNPDPQLDLFGSDPLMITGTY